MKKAIIPAIIANNQDELDKAVNKVKKYVSTLQLDIMDGKFVPNKSLEFDFRIPCKSCKYEAHLMVKEPKKWIERLLDRAELFLVHYESCENFDDIVDFLRKKGKKIGLVINPETTVEMIEKYLDEIDQVLVMTVNPGFYGSKFMPETLEKVSQLRKLRPGLNIEIDGGINDATIGLAVDAGANLFVSGSFILKSEQPGEAIKRLRELIK